MAGWIGWLGRIPALAHHWINQNAGEFRTGVDWGIASLSGGGEPLQDISDSGGCLGIKIGGADQGCWIQVDPSGKWLRTGCDPFGLYGVTRTTLGESTVFASDPRLLAALTSYSTGASATFNAAALHGYLSFSFVPTPETAFAGIFRLPAGSEVTIASGVESSVSTANWRETEDVVQTEESAITTATRLLRESVARKLGDDREVGVFLSGGLDSSLVAALLREVGARVHLFTLDFGAPNNAEIEFARAVAEHLDRPLTLVPAGPVQVQAALRRTAAVLEAPFGDAVTVPLYLLGQAAAQLVEVVFNGEGGDQLFGGWNNKPLIATASYDGEAFDLIAGYRRTFHRLDGQFDRYYSERALRLTSKIDLSNWLRPALEAPDFTSLLHRLRAANLWHKGAQNIAPRARQLAEAHRLRVRSPFFDRALAQWSFGLASPLLLNGACEKYILKRVAERYLPAEIVWRDKRGMGVPATDWIFGDLRREVGARLGPKRLGRSGWFDPAAIRALLKGEAEPGEIRRRRVGERIWMLVMLEAWIQESGIPLEWPGESG